MTELIIESPSRIIWCFPVSQCSFENQGGLCLYPTVWTPLLLYVVWGGRSGGSISRGCFVLEAAESQCPQQPLNLLLDAISIVNVWLESACSFSLSRFSVIPLLQQQNQILFRLALIVADMLACCSESCPNICDNGPLVPPDKDPRDPLGRAPAHNAQNKKSIMTGDQSIWHTIFAQWVERAGTRSPSRSHRCQKALEGVEWFHGGLGAPFWFRSNYWGPVAFKRIFF